MSLTAPVMLFLSYAQEDKSSCQEFEKHMSLLRRQGRISIWHHQLIPAGSYREQEIDEHFEQASIILLLISADFLASDYCYSHEMTRALQRHATGEVVVIPILVSACDWHTAPFAHLQWLPTNACPITQWADKNEGWTNVVEGIRHILQQLPISSQNLLFSLPSSKHAVSSLPHTPTSLPSSLEQRNRVRFLAKLHNSYTDFLNASLQGVTQIAVSFHSKPNAVSNLIQMRLRQPNVPEHPLPAETTLLQVFDHTSGELLVLGDPGAGKTIQLLTLAKVLCERAQQDERTPFPVIVNLSTWATTRKPLAEWLVEEIVKSYGVPRGAITRWVQQDQLLPLLDGLDEVDTSILCACVEAINTFKQQHFTPLVVCSRIGDYDKQQCRLVLQNAVVIQPLKENQVDDYFKAAGKPLADIRSVLRKNTELRELVRTPLMLHVVTLAYQELPVSALPKEGTTQQQQQEVLQRYVQRMFTPQSTRFSSQSMIKWISWLAKQMRMHNLTVFYLEHLQPEWLPAGRTQQIYEALAIRLYGILLGTLLSLFVSMIAFIPLSLPDTIWYGLMGALLGGLINRSSSTVFQFNAIVESWKRNGKALICLSACSAILMGVCTGWVYTTLADYGYIFGISTGLCVFLLCSIIAAGKRTSPPRTIPHRRIQWSWARWLVLDLHTNHLRLGAVVGLLPGLSYGLGSWLSFGLSYGLSYRLAYGLGYGLNHGLSYAIIGTLLSLLQSNAKRGIALTEIIAWSAKRLGQSLFRATHLKRTLHLFLLLSFSFGLGYGLYHGLGYGLSGGLSYGLSHGLDYGLDYGLNHGLSFNLVYWILFGIWNSFSQEVLDNRQRSTPNQGVRRSVRNGIFLGIVIGVLYGLVAFFNAIFTNLLFYVLNDGLSLSDGLRIGLAMGQNDGLGVGVAVAFVGAFLIALFTGVLAGLRHLLLRILLTRAGQLPWQTISFLDEATRRILLYRDGGGYRFIHRLLLEYFADLTSYSPPETQGENEIQVEQNK